MARTKNPNIKKANTPIEMTPNQIKEFKLCAKSPIYFIRNYVHIVHPKKGKMKFDMWDFQEEMVRSFYNNRYTITCLSRQVGKLLRDSELLATPNGFKPMGDMRIGDKVIDQYGNPCNVIFVSTQQFVPAYKITFDDGTFVISCHDHQWRVYSAWDNNPSPAIYTTKQLARTQLYRKNDDKYIQYKFYIPNTRPINYTKKQTILDPYLLGTWLGGMQENLELQSYNRLIEQMKIYYLNNNSQIPDQFLYNSTEQRIKLLQGLTDAIGTITDDGFICLKLPKNNIKLINDINTLICSLGLKVTRQHHDNDIQLSFIVGRDQFEVCRLPEKLQYQKLVLDNNQFNTCRIIQSIERVNDITGRCIQVDSPDNIYLCTKNYIPTHNTSTSAAFLLWYTSFHFDKTVLIASNKNANAIEIMHRVHIMYENIPMWLKPGVSDETFNKHEMEFDNGSRIISQATTPDTGRTFAISLLFLDELAFVEPRIAEEMWSAVAPTLATGGSCIITSTPNGDMNLFARLWRGAKVNANSFNPIFIDWHQVPGRDDEFKREQIGLIGARRWKQEYECLGIDTTVDIIDNNGNKKNITIGQLINELR